MGRPALSEATGIALVRGMHDLSARRQSKRLESRRNVRGGDGSDLGDSHEDWQHPGQDKHDCEGTWNPGERGTRDDGRFLGFFKDPQGPMSLSPALFCKARRPPRQGASSQTQQVPTRGSSAMNLLTGCLPGPGMAAGSPAGFVNEVDNTEERPPSLVPAEGLSQQSSPR